MAKIKPFQTQTQEETRIHRVEVINNIPIPSIEYVNKDYKVPKTLIKYYQADENGYKVLRDGKIWATHPFDFNDPFDCSLQMWELDNFPMEFAIDHLNEVKKELKKYGINLKETDDSNLIENVRKRYFDIFLRLLGIFCLNDSKNSELFWGYYNNHEGFSIVFDSDILSSDWNAWPLKVEYENVSNFEKITLKSKDVENHNIFPKVVRWATLKKYEWSHENEWRFIFLDIDLIFQNTRLKRFSGKAITKVVLGYKFFKDQVKDARDYSLTANTLTFIFEPYDNQYRLHILSLIYEKGIELYQIILSEDFRLIEKKIEILEIRNNKVTICYI